MKIKTILISLLFVPTFVLAQNQAPLPDAGFTPESSFYFLDKLGEAIQRFFTFNPESKARLEISFAKERIAEIKVVLDQKGVNAKGITVAETELQDNLKRVTAILESQKQAGKDTTALAQEISDDFNPAKEALKDTFKSEKEALEAKKEALKEELKNVRLAGDVAGSALLTQQLTDLAAQKNILEEHKNKSEQDIESENEHINEALGLQKEAAKKINEAKKEKAEFLSEVQKKNIALPEGTFISFDELVAQAEGMVSEKNYLDAKNTAKKASIMLKQIEKSFENLKEANEKEKELKDEEEIQKHELESKLKDASEEEAQKIKEEMEKKDEEMKKKQEEVKEEQKKIENKLEESKQEDQDSVQ